MRGAAEGGGPGRVLGGKREGGGGSEDGHGGGRGGGGVGEGGARNPVEDPCNLQRATPRGCVLRRPGLSAGQKDMEGGPKRDGATWSTRAAEEADSPLDARGSTKLTTPFVGRSVQLHQLRPRATCKSHKSPAMHPLAPSLRRRTATTPPPTSRGPRDVSKFARDDERACACTCAHCRVHVSTLVCVQPCRCHARRRHHTLCRMTVASPALMAQIWRRNRANSVWSNSGQTWRFPAQVWSSIAKLASSQTAHSGAHFGRRRANVGQFWGNVG